MTVGILSEIAIGFAGIIGLIMNHNLSEKSEKNITLFQEDDSIAESNSSLISFIIGLSVSIIIAFLIIPSGITTYPLFYIIHIVGIIIAAYYSAYLVYRLSDKYHNNLSYIIERGSSIGRLIGSYFLMMLIYYNLTRVSADIDSPIISVNSFFSIHFAISFIVFLIFVRKKSHLSAVITLISIPSMILLGFTITRYL